MHISLDQAIGRQPRLNRVGQSLLNIGSGASAAYSLRSLTGGDPKVVNVRRDANDEEREFTSTEVGTELADWVNGLQETTLPADVDSAAAAYSLRKVRSAYTGNAVQIRRTSDNVEVDVAFDSNDEVSTSSAITNVTESPDQGDTTATTLGEFLTEGGNQDATVVTWYDQSGNGNDATQDVAASQPLIAEGGTLSDYLDFDGTDDSLQTTSPWGITGTSDRSIFAVINSDEVSTGSKTYIGMGDNTNLTNAQKWDLSSEFAVRVQGGNEVYAYGTTDIDYLVTNIHSGTDVTDNSCFVNGTEQTATSSSAVTINTSNTVCRIGRYGGDFVSSITHFDGRIQEIIIYDSDQSSNRFKIESNINNHYGIYTAAEDGFVETWFDQSGNDNDAADASAASLTDQPQIVSSGSLLKDANGNPFIKFDTGDFLTIAGLKTEFKNKSNGYVSTVVEYTDTASGTEAIFFASTATGTSARLFLGKTTSNFSAAGRRENTESFKQSTASATADKTLLTGLWQWASGTVQLVVDGAAQTAASFDSAGVTDNNDSNSVFLARLSSNYIQGNVYELIAYNTDQSGNREALETNMADEYGITLS